MIEVECRIFIRKNKKDFLDKAKIDLLKEVRKGGSMRSAALKLGISYQHAWNLINVMNSLSSNPLVVKQRGGASGGGAMLTSDGERVLKEYEQIERQVRLFISLMNSEINM